MKIPGWWRVHHLYSYLIKKTGGYYRVILIERQNYIAKRKKVKAGINIIGYAKGDFGLAEHLRLVTHAIHTTSIKFCVNDSEDPGGHAQTNEGVSKFITKNKPYKINLFCYNASEAVRYLKSSQGEVALRKQYNIGYGYWELSEFPIPWREQDNYLNEIWAPSKFIQEVLKKSSTLPVYHMPIPVDFDDPVGYSRKHFKLPEHPFLFLFTFDLSSYIARKNPQAVIKAFTQAFPVDKNDQVCLIIKIHKIENNPEHIIKIEALKAQVCFDSRIIVFDEILDRASILGLIGICDAYVSLHRSEGFGLGMAEAMKMGKVVIATNYSGNTDFMNDHNSCPVKFNLIPVKQDEYLFVHEGAVWAEPDIDHASSYLRKVYDDHSFSKKIGLAAKMYIQKFHNFRVIGENYRKRVKDILNNKL